jgi:SAM-dependent MidA family methyltransferase
LSVERFILRMQTGNSALTQLIRSEIENHGPQSFAWFMQQALYHPEHGYYSSGRCRIGRRGDYFTNVSVGSFFGQLLASQFFEVWERLGRISDFLIVEQGAHDGQFARDVLGFAQTELPEFFDALCYRIVEPFRILEEQQRRALELFGDKIEWRTSLEPFTGIHFSNELLDAMPVRLITDETEKFVGLAGETFVFVERPADRTIPNQAALQVIDEIAVSLQRGYVIAIDYGRTEADFQPNVQVRARHQHLDSAFDSIGEADITMNVDWKSITERAQANGLRVAGFTDQHHFMAGIISQFESGDRGPLFLANSKGKRELQTLLHPEMLGRAFQVLALSRDVDVSAPPLAGFKFARRLDESA